MGICYNVLQKIFVDKQTVLSFVGGQNLSGRVWYKCFPHIGMVTSLRYNTNTPPEKQMFYLEVVGACISSDCKQKKITVVVSYIPKGKAAGMSVIQIKMVTGTVPVRESLNQLIGDEDKQILRTEVENNEVNIYLSSISNDATQVSFDVEEVVQVSNPQPGTAKVFDYYAPENSATTSYSFGDSDSAAAGP
ncbi:alpha-2-macroglobulin [Nephila pilipes]|uniref:Alpha-2-macroglobulin n=1 Tax=Nephila pilipes TaxID=299642 RepID=A0A8X6MFT5_NEPPI|nr:alpha-2-macroglobulin [Nephila pilipes]